MSRSVINSRVSRIGSSNPTGADNRVAHLWDTDDGGPARSKVTPDGGPWLRRDVDPDAPAESVPVLLAENL
jgi:WD40 repeat protein